MTQNSGKTPTLIYARIAGFTFLFYIAAGIASMNLPDSPQVTDLLSVLMSFSALALGVTLYALTREQGSILALMALTCRILEAAQVGNSEIYFAAGSALFCWLLLRGRIIPVALAWLGVISSVLLVVILPLQVAGLFGGEMAWSASITWLVWMPMLAFELAVSVWLLVKGAAMPAPGVAPASAS